MNRAYVGFVRQTYRRFSVQFYFAESFQLLQMGNNRKTMNAENSVRLLFVADIAISLAELLLLFSILISGDACVYVYGRIGYDMAETWWYRTQFRLCDRFSRHPHAAHDNNNANRAPYILMFCLLFINANDNVLRQNTVVDAIYLPPAWPPPLPPSPPVPLTSTM